MRRKWCKNLTVNVRGDLDINKWLLHIKEKIKAKEEK